MPRAVRVVDDAPEFYVEVYESFYNLTLDETLDLPDDVRWKHFVPTKHVGPRRCKGSRGWQANLNKKIAMGPKVSCAEGKTPEEALPRLLKYAGQLYGGLLHALTVEDLNGLLAQKLLCAAEHAVFERKLLTALSRREVPRRINA